MQIGDLVTCIGKKPEEPNVGELGIVVKAEPEKNLYVAYVPQRGRGRIWKEDWCIAAPKGILS